MPTVSVLLQVLELVDFLSDLNRATGALDKLKIPAYDLEKSFDSVGNALGKFAGKIWDVVSVTLGVLLRDAIQGVIRWFGELISTAWKSAEELQLVQMRLEGFNLQAAIDSGLDFNDAMEESIRLTKEQVSWIIKLSITTPYDSADIAYVYSMSMAFGFTADEAKELTENTMDFVAAMGLTGVEAKRVIVNLGQMAQRGKITTREMNDLARGSLLPLADVLDRVAAKMGVTTEELTKMISAPGAGVDYKLFMDAFNEMIGQEERFQDAAWRMAHSFQGAMANVYESITGVISNFVLIPGFLEPIGMAIGNIMDDIGGGMDEINAAAYRVGAAIGRIVTVLLEKFLPSGKAIAGGIVGALENLADWIEGHQKQIVAFFTDIADTIKEDIIPWIKDKLIPALGDIYNWFVAQWPTIQGFFMGVYNIIKDNIVPWIRDNLIPAFNQINKWLDTNRPRIDEFFRALGEIVGKVVQELLGEDKWGSRGREKGLAQFLDLVLIMMQWIIDNTELIANFIALWIKFQIYAELAKLALGIIIEYLKSLFSFDLTVIMGRFLMLAGIIAAILANLQQILNTILVLTGSQWRVNLGYSGSTEPPPPSSPTPQWNPKTTNPLPSTTPTKTGKKGYGSMLPPKTGYNNPGSTPMASTAGGDTNYNLTINSSARTEPIIQDFKALQALA